MRQRDTHIHSFVDSVGASTAQADVKKRDKLNQYVCVQLLHDTTTGIHLHVNQLMLHTQRFALCTAWSIAIKRTRLCCAVLTHRTDIHCTSIEYEYEDVLLFTQHTYSLVSQVRLTAILHRVYETENAIKQIEAMKIRALNVNT